MQAISILVAIGLASCVSSPFATSKQIRDRQLVTRAKQEIARRGLSLPVNYTTEVVQTEAILEIPPYSKYFYAVTFLRPTPKRSVPLYTLSFERQTGKFDQFDDRRGEVTPEEIAAAKRAMIQRVGGVPENFSTTAGVSGHKVECWILDLRRGKPRRSGHCFVSRKTLKITGFTLREPPTI